MGQRKPKIADWSVKRLEVTFAIRCLKPLKNSYVRALNYKMHNDGREQADLIGAKFLELSGDNVETNAIGRGTIALVSRR